ncbi:unnamed protein product, partial [Closterium sp. NIES-65]
LPHVGSVTVGEAAAVRRVQSAAEQSGPSDPCKDGMTMQQQWGGQTVRARRHTGEGQPADTEARRHTGEGQPADTPRDGASASVYSMEKDGHRHGGLPARESSFLLYRALSLSLSQWTDNPGTAHMTERVRVYAAGRRMGTGMGATVEEAKRDGAAKALLAWGKVWFGEGGSEDAEEGMN